MGETMSYTGDEAAVDLAISEPVEPHVVFEIKPKNLPPNAVPIYDQELRAVIGYRVFQGLYYYLDLAGNVVHIEERGLKSPLLDPTDLIWIFRGVVVRSLGKGALTTGTQTVATGIRLSAKTIAASALASMRAFFRGLSSRSLKFTAKTVTRMCTKERHVPMQTLQLAIKYGKRALDPQGVKGAYEYTMPLIRNGKNYILKVIVRETDWVILHFHYF